MSRLKLIGPHRYLALDGKILEQFKSFEQKHGNNEAGGVLLGYVYKDYDLIVKATVPNKWDSSGLFFFRRAKQPAQRHINQAWKKSEGFLIYLGEWHTHCEVNPVPSSNDKNMIQKAVAETKMEIDYLYLIIIGQDDSIWIGRQTKEGKLVKLKLAE